MTTSTPDTSLRIKPGLFQQLYCYSMNKKHSTFAGMRFELDDNIDQEIMQQSLKTASERMSYFQIKKTEEDGAVYFRPNTNPVKLHSDPLEYTINESENDEFLYRLSVHKNYLTISMFHALTDSVGLIHFMQIMLAEYYRKLGEDVTLPDGAYHSGGSASEDEYNDPMEIVSENETVTAAGDTKDKFYIIPDKRSKDLNLYSFSCDRKNFIKYAKSCGGSPNSVSEILLARAIDKCRDDRSKPVKLDITISAKKFLGADRSNQPLLQSSSFSFDSEKLYSDDILLNKNVRKKLRYDCSEKNILPHLKRICKLKQMFDNMPSIKSKKILAGQATFVPRCTAAVSYTSIEGCFGKDIEKHLRSVMVFCESVTPTLEIACLNKKFFFCLSTYSDGRNYIEKFRELMIEKEFDCSEIREYKFKDGNGKAETCKMGLNIPTIRMINAARKIKKQK